MSDTPDKPMPESDVVDAKKVALAAVGVGALIVFATVAAFFLWKAWRADDTIDARHLRFSVQDGDPLLESAPQPDRAAFEAGKQRILREWAWVDPGKGIARIPLDQAMQIMAAGNAGAGVGASAGIAGKDKP
jgi:hypothetical protein